VKEVIRLALANSPNRGFSDFSGGRQANSYLRARGFEIMALTVDRDNRCHKTPPSSTRAGALAGQVIHVPDSRLKDVQSSALMAVVGEIHVPQP